MARFIGTAQGSRGSVSRLGGKDGGINTSARGWNAGINVRGFVNDKGEDQFDVYRTSGSNGASGSTKIGSYTSKGEVKS